VGQGSGLGSSGHPKGLQGVGCSNALSADLGLIAKAGPEASLGVDPSKEMGVARLVVGRSGMDNAIRVGPPAQAPSSCLGEPGPGSPAQASSSRLGEPGSGSRSEMAGLEVVECSVSSSKWRETGPALVSPAPVYLGLKTPVCLSLGKREVSTEPSKLLVYQRSRWRFSKPLQSVGPSCLSGQLESRGLLGPISPASPVRLDFDGVEVEPRESGYVPPSSVTLDSAPNSDEVVPESVPGEVSAGSGMAGVNSVVAEKLDGALVVGEVMGMTCEGKTGLLKKFLGQIVVENLGRSAGDERGSHVLNES
jgi:hypothetical protein